MSITKLIRPLVAKGTSTETYKKIDELQKKVRAKFIESLKNKPKKDPTK